MESEKHLQANWWMFLVRGIVALLFGLVTIVAPETTLAILALSFGLFLLVSGVIDIIFGITSVNKREFWVLYLTLGVVQAGFGVYLLKRPGLTIAAFITFVALSLLFRGILEIASAFETKLDAGLKVLSVVAGVLTVLASIVIWRYPVVGSLAFVWVLGLYALISGPVWIAYSLEVRTGKTELVRA